MKIRGILLLLVLPLVFTSLGQSKIDTVTIKTRILCDHCKTCETCGEMMERDLYLTHGIRDVTFNTADTTITVVFKHTKIDPETIRHQIAKMGYDADHIPAEPKGIAKLDECCTVFPGKDPQEK